MTDNAQILMILMGVGPKIVRIMNGSIDTTQVLIDDDLVCVIHYCDVSLDGLAVWNVYLVPAQVSAERSELVAVHESERKAIGNDHLAKQLSCYRVIDDRIVDGSSLRTPPPMLLEIRKVATRHRIIA